MRIWNGKVLAALIATGATLLALMLLRGYPWTLALIVAAAAGILVYTTGSTLERLRGLFRK
jgi:hypothetical protein